MNVAAATPPTLRLVTDDDLDPHFLHADTDPKGDGVKPRVRCPMCDTNNLPKPQLYGPAVRCQHCNAVLIAGSVKPRPPKQRRPSDVKAACPEFMHKYFRDPSASPSRITSA